MENRVVINANDYWSLLTGRHEKGANTQLSSYDIPKVIGVESKDGTLHVHFEYVDNEEPVKLEALHSGVRVKVGKHSGKVLGLEVDRDHDDIRELFVKLTNALGFMGDHAKKFNQKANYELAKAVFEKNSDPLLAKS